MEKLRTNLVHAMRNGRLNNVNKPNRRKIPEFFVGELEKRQLLATYLVNNLSDAASTPGSLRWAVNQANSNTTDPTDSIIFDSSLNGQTITLTNNNGPISIFDASGGNLTINGPGQANLTISGGNTTGIFKVSTNTTIANLSIKYGNGGGMPTTGWGGAIYNNRTNLTLESITLANSSARYGGAIASYGSTSGPATLNISNSTLSNNDASQQGGAVYSCGNSGNATLNITNSTLSYNNSTRRGGAVYSDGIAGNATLNILGSTLSYNIAKQFGGAVFSDSLDGNARLNISRTTLSFNNASDGGAVYSDGLDGNATLNILDSTLLYNIATDKGGAVYSDSIDDFATLNISRSTLSYNSAGDGGAIYSKGLGGQAPMNVNQTTIAFNSARNGGGIDNEGILNLYNSIVAENTATSTGPDVSGTLAVTQYTIFSSISGTTFSTSSVGSIVGNPRLGRLGFYGGNTQTIPLLSGSPAIAGVIGSRANGTTDIRGYTPPASVTANADIGAFQTGGQLNGSVTVNTTGETAALGQVTLRQAINLANLWAGTATTVNFAGNLTTTGNATITLQNTTSGYGPITINAPGNTTTISGPTSGNTITISGGNFTGIFAVASNATISNLTLTHANGNGLTAGGAIYSNNILSLNSVIINNSTSAVYLDGGSATLNQTTLANSLVVTNAANLTINGGTVLNPLTIASGNVISVTNYAQNLQFGNTTALNLNANITNGNITQALNTNLSVSGTASFIATGDITLNRPTNNFNTVSASGTNVTLINSDAIQLGMILSTNLEVNSTGGAITQASGTNITVSGTADFISPNNITLNNTTNSFSTITAGGSVVTIHDSNAIQLDTISAVHLTISAGGAITQSDAVDVSGSSVFNAIGNAITLDQNENDLGDVTTNGYFAISAGDADTLTAVGGLVSVSGTANISGLTTTSVNLNQTGGTLNNLLITGGSTTNLTSGLFIGNANVANGTLLTGINLFSLDVGVNGTANLTGGSIAGNVTSAGSLITIINLSNVTVSAGSVTINGGMTRIVSGSGASAHLVSGTLDSAASLTNLSVASGSTANISGGSIGATTNAGTLNGTGGTFTALDVTGGNTTLSSGSVTNLANVTGGLFTSAVNLGSLSTSGGTSNITGGIIIGDINVNGGHVTLAGTQQGDLNVNTTDAVDINTAIAGLTTVTNSCLTTVNANLTGGLTINAATGSVYFVPTTAINVGATTITGNVPNQIVPANTTLASLDQSSGTVDLSGTVTGLAYITGGTLNSSGQIGSLTVGTNGTANLTGGNVTGATATSGSLSVGSGAGINTLVVNNGTSSVSGSVSGDASVNDGSLTLVNGSTAAGNVSVNHGNLYANGTIGGDLSVGTLGGSAEVQSGGVVQGVTNVSATGTLVVEGQLQQSLNISGFGASANVTTTGNVTGQTTVNTGGSLTTDGTLTGGLNVNNSTVNTYASGTSISSNNLTLGSASTWTANGSTITDYGTISAPAVTIASGANLTLDAGFTMANESAFTLINNTGNQAVSGTFYGLPEGSRLMVGGNNVTLSYYGGSGGNDVVLYRTGGLSTVVNTNLDINNATDNLITLREAINYARLNALSSGNPQDITFDASALFGGSNANTITLSNATDYGVLSVNVNTTLSINGPAVNTANSLTVSGGGVTGIFSLTTPTNISNLTLSGANGDVGGAIFNNATSTLNDMTIQDNFASGGGGLWNHENGDLTIINSTFANNTATSIGGAIENVGGIISIRQSTIAYNTVVSGSGSGGGLNKIGGSVTLLNTIVANNTASQGPDIFASVNANNSLIGDNTDAVINGSDNLTNMVVLLGSLGYYGGTTKVYPLLPGSPAINTGCGTNAIDQRGITGAGTADIGSFQSRGFNITKTGGGDEVTMIGDAFPTALTLNITSSYNEPVVGGVISFTFANSTGGGTSANGTGFTPATSQATIVQNANVSDGNITLTAVANANYSNETYKALGNATGANAAAGYVMTNVGTPSSITITGGDYQSGPLTGSFGQFLGINVKDSVGNNIPRLSVTFSPQTTAYGATGTINSSSAYSTATDANGNITGLTYAPNGIGGLVTIVANATVAENSVRPAGTALNEFHEGALGLNVQNGLIGRSFVNNVDAVLGNTALAANLVTSGNVRIKYLGMDGTASPANTTGSAALSSGGTGNVTLSYGATGIGGNQNSDQGDGIYQLEVDYTGNNFANATQVTTVKFHRLFGDVNGDKVVDAWDYTAVTNRSVYGRFGIYSQDTNGTGRVFSKDLITVLRQRGRRVSNYSAYA